MYMNYVNKTFTTQTLNITVYSPRQKLAGKFIVKILKHFASDEN